MNSGDAPSEPIKGRAPPLPRGWKLERQSSARSKPRQSVKAPESLGSMRGDLLRASLGRQRVCPCSFVFRGFECRRSGKRLLCIEVVYARDCRARIIYNSYRVLFFFFFFIMFGQWRVFSTGLSRESIYGWICRGKFWSIFLFVLLTFVRLEWIILFFAEKKSSPR